VKAFVAVGHDEYWSPEMRSNVEAARDRTNNAVNLVFLTGNTCYRRIHFKTNLRVFDCYKALYPEYDLWRSVTNQPNHEYTMVGLETVALGYSGPINLTNITDHWAFKYTPLEGHVGTNYSLPYLGGSEVEGCFENIPCFNPNDDDHKYDINLNLFRATRAKSQLALSLCKLLRTLEEQLKTYRQQIRELFQSHPDHDIFGSLPGAKEFLAPRLLGAIGSDPQRYGSHNVLQACAGTAPVSYQTGQIHKAQIRWACDRFLRHTIHLWAECFRRASLWGQIYYQQKRKEGMSHACALRCLGQRLLKIVFRMIADKKPYDAEFHARNQHAHGSWVLKLMNDNPRATL
jgi:hypothetical protein